MLRTAIFERNRSCYARFEGPCFSRSFTSRSLPRCFAGCSKPAEPAKTDGGKSAGGERTGQLGRLQKIRYRPGGVGSDGRRLSQGENLSGQRHGAADDPEPRSKADRRSENFRRRLRTAEQTRHGRLHGPRALRREEISRLFGKLAGPSRGARRARQIGHQNHRSRSALDAEFGHGTGRRARRNRCCCWKTRRWRFCSRAPRSRCFGEPGEIDGHPCYRVQVRDPYGLSTFWIDQESLVLRRIVLPTDALRAEVEQTDGRAGRKHFARRRFPRRGIRSAGRSEGLRVRNAGGAIPDRQILHSAASRPMDGQKGARFQVHRSGRQSDHAAIARRKSGGYCSSGRENFPIPSRVCSICKSSSTPIKTTRKWRFAPSARTTTPIRRTLENYCRSMKIAMPIYRNLEETDPGLRNTIFRRRLSPRTGRNRAGFRIRRRSQSARRSCRRKSTASWPGKNLSEQAIERYRKELEEYEKAVEDAASGEAQAVPAGENRRAQRTENVQAQAALEMRGAERPGQYPRGHEPKRRRGCWSSVRRTRWPKSAWTAKSSPCTNSIWPAAN